MDLQSTLISIKRLVDDCEETIKEGKLAISTRSLERASKFIDLTRSMTSYALQALLDAKSIIDLNKEDDKLVKYISVYYRTALLVSLPYISTILKELIDVLDSQMHADKAREASHLLQILEEIRSTLRA
ncbi:MAG: hypothetical protein QXK88_05685 [Desulfurococcaceae archaeon]